MILKIGVFFSSKFSKGTIELATKSMQLVLQELNSDIASFTNHIKPVL